LSSFTRQQFNHWLAGEKNDLVNTQIDLLGTPSVVPAEVLPPAMRGAAYALSCYREPTRWSFLDRICERLAKEGKAFMSNPTDADASEWTQRLKAIRRDVHKAHAFVRFKKISVGDKEIFSAWHRPQHDTLDLFVRLFCRRFPKMDWTVVTATESAHFRDGELHFGPGREGQCAEIGDDWEAFWRTYYASIYNPARMMIKAMKKEMPMHHWQTLPEARLIPGLIRGSSSHLQRMVGKAQATAERFVSPEMATLEAVSAALPACEGCQLAVHCRPTPGAGNAQASLVLVGEQPGDEEEKRGEPFIGPAGQLLWKVAAEAGVDWTRLYVTNAVKHFKYEYQGPFRLHKRPDRDEVAACRPWFQREMAIVKPKVVLCLGSTAALSVTGRLWPVERYRGTWLPSSSPYRVLLTYHPAAILRAPAEKASVYYADLLRDLALAQAA